MSKLGRCPNYGGCKKADNREDQIIPDGNAFVCSECKTPLIEKKRKSNTNKSTGIDSKILIIGGIVVVGIIAALFFLFSGDKEDEVEILPEVPAEVTDSVETVKEEVVNRNDTLVIKIEGQENLSVDQTSETEAENQPEEIAEVVEDVAVEQPVAVPATEPKPAPAVKAATAAKPAQASTHKLSYGTWTGGMKNGKPHGTGTLTYSTSQTIDSRDTKGRVAQPGEYIVGEWDNGHLVQGRWFKKDGSKEAIILGKAG